MVKVRIMMMVMVMVKVRMSYRTSMAILSAP